VVLNLEWFTFILSCTSTRILTYDIVKILVCHWLLSISLRLMLRNFVIGLQLRHGCWLHIQIFAIQNARKLFLIPYIRPCSFCVGSRWRGTCTFRRYELFVEVLWEFRCESEYIVINPCSCLGLLSFPFVCECTCH